MCFVINNVLEILNIFVTSYFELACPTFICLVILWACSSCAYLSCDAMYMLCGKRAWESQICCEVHDSYPCGISSLGVAIWMGTRQTCLVIHAPIWTSLATEGGAARVPSSAVHGRSMQLRTLSASWAETWNSRAEKSLPSSLLSFSRDVLTYSKQLSPNDEFDYVQPTPPFKTMRRCRSLDCSLREGLVAYLSKNR